MPGERPRRRAET